MNDEQRKQFILDAINKKLNSRHWWGEPIVDPLLVSLEGASCYIIEGTVEFDIDKTFENINLLASEELSEDASNEDFIQGNLGIPYKQAPPNPYAAIFTNPLDYLLPFSCDSCGYLSFAHGFCKHPDGPKMENRIGKSRCPLHSPTVEPCTCGSDQMCGECREKQNK